MNQCGKTRSFVWTWTDCDLWETVRLVGSSNVMVRKNDFFFTFSSSGLAVSPTILLDPDTLVCHYSSVSLWKTVKPQLSHVDVCVDECLRVCQLEVCSTHITVTLLQLGLLLWTMSSFSCPVTPRCVSGHKHLPGTNVLHDSLTAQTDLWDYMLICSWHWIGLSYHSSAYSDNCTKKLTENV